VDVKFGRLIIAEKNSQMMIKLDHHDGAPARAVFLIETAQKSRIEESPGYAVPRLFRRMAHRQMPTCQGARAKLHRFLY